MVRVVSSVVQAFDLLTASDRPGDLLELHLDRKGALSAAQIAAFETSVGWPIPEAYRTLLASCGPFDLRFADEDEIELFEFLGQDRALEQRAALKTLLTKISASIPADDELYPVMTLPVEHLLPATMNHDDNGRTSFTFWERDVDALYFCHEREGLDESDDTLEQYVIERVAAYAHYDLHEQRWYE
jgi:hypothetical protein